MERILFYLLSFIAVASAIASVTNKKMLRSVVYLLFSLIAIAGFYFMIDYNFLAAIQLTVYAGGIIVLIIFSVLLVSHIEMELEMAKPSRKWLSAIVTLIGAMVVIYTLHLHPFKTTAVSESTTTKAIGERLLSTTEGGFILPFELISVLLLASMIGAIIIAKGTKLTNKKD
jgi:NADH-quinone oxidoreductase subunit J